MPADHSDIQTTLNIVETNTIPEGAAASADTLYYRISDRRYFRPCVDSNDGQRVVPLIASHGKHYTREDLRQLIGEYEREAPSVLVATSPALPTSSVAYGTAYDHDAWTISANGDVAGIESDSTTEEILRLPARPAITASVVLGLSVRALIDGSPHGELFVPWGGFSAYAGTAAAGGATLISRIRETTPRMVHIRTDLSSGNWTLQIFGAGTGQVSDTTIQVHIVRIV